MQRYREQTTYVQKLAAELTEEEFQALQARFFIRQAEECYNEMSEEERSTLGQSKQLYLLECAVDICTQGMYSSKEVPDMIRGFVEDMI